MDTITKVLEVIKNYPIIVNVPIIIIGWWIINRQNNKRETRKEIRALLNDVQSMIGEIEAEAILYHTEEYDLGRRSQLTFKASLMSKKIQIVTRALDVDLIGHINKMRNSIMTKNWDRNEHHALALDDNLIKKIHLESSELSIQLENNFASFYHK